MKIQVHKAASAAKFTPTEADMPLINAQAQRELAPDEVFVFRCETCNDQVDRDFERFPLETLQKLAPMLVGKTMICDHQWSSANQRARIYAASVEHIEGGINALMTKCYMLRTESTREVIAAIEGGILKEVSVGCLMGRAICSICGESAYGCPHINGIEYEGKTCVYDLLDPLDAYEQSFVAVPAQPRAGVTKGAKTSGWTPAEIAAAKVRLEIEKEKWRFV